MVLLNEFDYDAKGSAIELFKTRYLAVGQGGARALDYPHVFLAPSNTGLDSGHDLDRDGKLGGPGDAFGFGRFQGQFGMVLLSRLEIDRKLSRTFQKTLWRDMPDARLPDDPRTAAPGDWYSPDVLARLRLSSKSHWDVVLKHGSRRIHVLCAHPTPPVFDGIEDRNGRRNHDEIRFWADYTLPWRARWIVDDDGRRGGLDLDEPFVILGDYNADPRDGDSTGQAAQWLLKNPRLRVRPVPSSDGAREAARIQGGINAEHASPPRFDTGDFPDDPPRGPGNLRLDYALPSIHFSIERASVFWPNRADPLRRLVATKAAVVSSDHRLVSVDVALGRPQRVRWTRWRDWWRWLATRP